MTEIKFDRILEISYSINEPDIWCQQQGDKKKVFIRNTCPKTVKFFTERQLKTLGNQPEGHFAEVKAMSWYIKQGHDTYYIESGYITKHNWHIREIVEQHFRPEQKDYLFSVKLGGIPDLLVGKDNNWWFVEVKLIKNYEDKPTKTQLQVFPRMQALGIQIHLAKLIPVHEPFEPANR